GDHAGRDLLRGSRPAAPAQAPGCRVLRVERRSRALDPAPADPVTVHRSPYGVGAGERAATVRTRAPTSIPRLRAVSRETTRSPPPSCATAAWHARKSARALLRINGGPEGGVSAIDPILARTLSRTARIASREHCTIGPASKMSTMPEKRKPSRS